MTTGHGTDDGWVLVAEDVEKWHQLGLVLLVTFRLGEDDEVFLIAQLLEILQRNGVHDASIKQFLAVQLHRARHDDAQSQSSDS